MHGRSSVLFLISVAFIIKERKTGTVLSACKLQQGQVDIIQACLSLLLCRRLQPRPFGRSARLPTPELCSWRWGIGGIGSEKGGETGGGKISEKGGERGGETGLFPER